MKLLDKNKNKVDVQIKRKYQFVFPVNEKYLEIDRDFVWTGFAQYGFIIQNDGSSSASGEVNSTYDERVITNALSPLIVHLPNFFDFQLYVNDRKLFNKPINFRAIPTIEHMLKLPCEYYLPKGTKIFCDTPFVGSYFNDASVPPAGILKDGDAFIRKNITLYLDGYEVDSINRDTAVNLPKPYIYAVGGYFALSGENYDSSGNANYPFASIVTDIEGITGITWPRANDEQFTLASQILSADKDNPLSIKYEKDCLITKIWRYDWQLFCLDRENPSTQYRLFEYIIDDGKLTFPYLPTKAIGSSTTLANDITLDLIRKAPRYNWLLAVGSKIRTLNNLLQYLRVQKRDIHNYLYQRNINLQEILNALHIPTPQTARDIVPLRKKMSDSDVWNFKLKYTELVEHDGIETNNFIWLDGPTIGYVKFNYVKRLILLGVKEFSNE